MYYFFIFCLWIFFSKSSVFFLKYINRKVWMQGWKLYLTFKQQLKAFVLISHINSNVALSSSRAYSLCDCYCFRFSQCSQYLSIWFLLKCNIRVKCLFTLTFCSLHCKRICNIFIRVFYCLILEKKRDTLLIHYSMNFCFQFPVFFITVDVLCLETYVTCSVILIIFV